MKTACCKCEHFAPIELSSMGRCRHKSGPNNRLFTRHYVAGDYYPRGCPIDPDPVQIRIRPKKKKNKRGPKYKSKDMDQIMADLWEVDMERSK